MKLSPETLEGIRITGIYDKYIPKLTILFGEVYSFIEVSKFLISQKDGLFLLSERFNQGPLESYFGQQRARGGRSDNPSVRNFLYTEQAIRVQRSMAIGSGGNVKKRKQQWTTDMDDLCRPLKKRPRRCLLKEL
jgi:hypothetical protein